MLESVLILGDLNLEVKMYGARYRCNPGKPHNKVLMAIVDNFNLMSLTVDAMCAGPVCSYSIFPAIPISTS